MRKHLTTSSTTGNRQLSSKEKGDECIFVGYSNQSRAYRVFNKITRVIMESIHVNFDELHQMASDQNSSDPAPECQTMALEHNSLSPGRQCQENVSHEDKTVTTLNELDLLFSLMFDKLLNGPSHVVPKSSVVTTADECIQRQQLTTPLVNHTTPDQSCQVQSHESSVTSNENINQAELNAKNDQVANDEFINIFSTPIFILDSMARDFSKFTTWTVTSLSRMMDRAGVSYPRYSESPVQYQRCSVRHRTEDASTPADPQQPDP
nr:retrovirus-related Pol polyprotein from transposon TNT 1-94 [Tanacetum cinerariifolium]